MRTTKSRIDVLESTLTPKQSMLLWMEEAHRHRSMQEYVRSLRNKPDSAYPLCHLPDAVEKSVRESKKGLHRTEVRKAVRKAVRDVIFLFFLHQEANRRMSENERAYVLQGMLLRTELRWLEDRIEHHLASKRKRSPENFRDRLSRWKSMCEMFLLEILSVQHAFESLSAHYLDGHDVLFSDVRESLSGVVEFVEVLAELFNDDLIGYAQLMGKHKIGAIPIADVRARAANNSSAYLKVIVDMAKVEALELTGDRERAFGLLRESDSL